jgi:hypothetical protein
MMVYGMVEWCKYKQKFPRVRTKNVQGANMDEHPWSEGQRFMA